jgi:hypothetical protein
METGVALFRATEKDARAGKRKMLSAKQEAAVERQLLFTVRGSFALITTGAADSEPSDENLLGNGLDEELSGLEVRAAEDGSDADD